MSSRLKIFSFCILLVCFSFGLSFATSPGYEIPRQVLSGGGGMWLSTTSYKLSSTLGQSIAGVQNGATKTVYTGFWCPWVVQMSPVEWEEVDYTQRPTDFALHQNYPNPFNPSTIIQYALPRTALVKIEVYNVLGQRVRTLVDRIEEPGYKIINWNGKDDSGNQVCSGVYFCRICAGDFVKSKKMTLLK
jgi:hypothetical protein